MKFILQSLKKIKKLTDKIVYKAEVEINGGINELSTKVNFGVSETEFTTKCNNHTMSFRSQTHESDFKLSKFIWSLNGPFFKNLLDQNRAFLAS